MQLSKMETRWQQQTEELASRPMLADFRTAAVEGIMVTKVTTSVSDEFVKIPGLLNMTAHHVPVCVIGSTNTV